MDKPKPGLPTAEIARMILPIIADLGDGWFLATHPNGAGIGCATFWTALSTESGESSLEDWGEDLDEIRSPVPETIRAKAVEAFEKLAWPLVRKQFYDT